MDFSFCKNESYDIAVQEIYKKNSRQTNYINLKSSNILNKPSQSFIKKQEKDKIE
jgi:hypothetical protein